MALKMKTNLIFFATATLTIIGAIMICSESLFSCALGTFILVAVYFLTKTIFKAYMPKIYKRCLRIYAKFGIY